VTDSDLPTPADSLQRWLDAVAAPSVAPAGGSAAGIVGALAAALAAMVAGLTVTRERYAGVEAEASHALSRATVLRSELLGLAVQDAEVFAGFIRALGLPRNTEAERGVREEAKREALRRAARVQLALLTRVAEAAELALSMAEAGLASAMGDAASGVFLAAAAARSAHWSVRSDLALGQEGGAKESSLAQARTLLERAEAAERRVGQLLRERAG
jgi:formiminotetrahydrofolate cyclodeaminase